MPGPANNLTVRKRNGAAYNWRGCDYLSERDDIGNAISNEKPSLDRGWPGAVGSTTRGELPFDAFESAEEPVRLTIGNFVKAGASQTGRASEVPGPTLFGRICELQKTSLASMRSGRRWQEQA